MSIKIINIDKNYSGKNKIVSVNKLSKSKISSNKSKLFNIKSVKSNIKFDESRLVEPNKNCKSVDKLKRELIDLSKTIILVDISNEHIDKIIVKIMNKNIINKITLKIIIPEIDEFTTKKIMEIVRKNT